MEAKLDTATAIFPDPADDIGMQMGVLFNAARLGPDPTSMQMRLDTDTGIFGDPATDIRLQIGSLFNELKLGPEPIQGELEARLNEVGMIIASGGFHLSSSSGSSSSSP